MSKKKTLLYGIMGLFCLTAKLSKAQIVRLQRGIIYKQGSGIRLGSVKVLNTRTGITAQSDMYGVYAVMAQAGDSLDFSGAGFVTGKAVVTDFVTKVSYLVPASELPEVEIKGNTLFADLQEVKTGYRNKSVFYTGTPHYYYLFVKPMTFIYENFKSEVIQARKFKKYARKELESSEVSSRFNDQFIKSYILISDRELFPFKLHYWPELQQLNSWSDYDLASYIRASYEAFKHDRDKRNKQAVSVGCLL